MIIGILVVWCEGKSCHIWCCILGFGLVIYGLSFWRGYGPGLKSVFMEFKSGLEL